MFMSLAALVIQWKHQHTLEMQRNNYNFCTPYYHQAYKCNITGVILTYWEAKYSVSLSSSDIQSGKHIPNYFETLVYVM